jgi:hypothetical protein
MQYKVHYDIDREATSSHYQHYQRLFHKLSVYYPHRGLIDQENGKSPNNKKISQCTQKFHAMIAEAHNFSGFLPREPDKHKGDNKANEISNQVKGIAEYRN